MRVILAEHVDRGEAWGTEQGAHVFAAINKALIDLNDGTLVELDYSGLRRSDVSFQREAVVETLRKHRPRLLFVVVNLVDPDLRLNLQVALEKLDTSLVAVEPTRKISIIGRKLTPEQEAVLEFVSMARGVTSARLTKAPFSLRPSTASNQLTALWRAGLVRRVEGAAASGGREYRYDSLLNA